MKRSISLFLTLCMVLGLLACGDQVFAAEIHTAEKTEAITGELDEAAFLELSHKLYEANQLEALLSRHSSLKYTLVYPETPEKNNFYWETAEVYYQEWPGFDYARYDCDRVYYVMQEDSDGIPYIACGLDLSSDYDPFFDLYGIPEEEFLDTEHEQLVGSFMEDGLLHILTEYDEEGSREWVEDRLERAWEGEKLCMEFIIDPETYEFLQNTSTLEKNGETWVAYGYVAEFDTPEPFSCRLLRAWFEQQNVDVMTASAMAYPGTERECSVSVTLPKNTPIEINTDDTYAAFDDAEGTSLSSLIAWRGTTDFNAFVFPNPDQPLINRYNAMVTEAMAERGPAVDLNSITVEAMIAANAPEAVFARHQTVFCTTHNRFDGDWGFCAAPGLYFESDYDGWNNLLDNDANWFLTEDDDGERTFSREWYIMSEAERQAVQVRPEELSAVIDLDLTRTEKLVDVTDNLNGTLTIVTRKNAEDTRAGLEAKGIEYTAELQDAELEIVYLVAADTLEILSYTEYFITEAERSLCDITAVCYDAELPECVAEMQAMKEEVLASGAEDLKTITVVYDAGTPSEESYSLTVPRDVRVQLIFRDGYGDQYADPERINVFDGTPDAEGNFLIYLFRE